MAENLFVRVVFGRERQVEAAAQAINWEHSLVERSSFNLEPTTYVCVCLSWNLVQQAPTAPPVSTILLIGQQN